MNAHQLAPFTLAKAAEIIEAVMIRGDLANLTSEERAKYYVRVCQSVGLNPMTRPLEYIVLNGKLTLYARKDATDQLRALHKVSVTDLTETEREGVWIVTAKVCNAEGRTDAAKGAVHIAGLKGEILANALMKAECVPLHSEILTRDGFKRYNQVTIGEEVLAYDCGSDRTVWTPLLNVTKYDSAPLVTMQSTKGQFSVICTPDHSWAIRSSEYRQRSSGARKARGPYSNRQAARRLVRTNKINKGQKIILAAPETDTTDSLLTPIEAAILGWAVTDGTIQRRGSFVRVGICQSKEVNFAAIRELVGDAKEIVSPARTRTFPMTGRTYDTLEQHWWYLPSAAGRQLLAKAGYQTRADLPKIVTRLDARARSSMLHAMMLAEGDARGIFANGDPSIIEAFDILATMQGKATGQLKVKDTIWTKRLKITRHVAGSFLTIRPEDAAAVWCPTTAFGTWIMRQGGRVMITGNTKAKRRATLSLCGLGMLDENEIEDIPASAKGAFQTRETVTMQTLPKKDARSIYTRLQAELDAETTSDGLGEWWEASAERVRLLHPDWQEVLRMRYEESLAALQQHENTKETTKDRMLADISNLNPKEILNWELANFQDYEGMTTADRDAIDEALKARQNIPARSKEQIFSDIMSATKGRQIHTETVQ